MKASNRRIVHPGATLSRAVLAGLLFTAVGCQTIEKERAVNTEELLQLAGFDVRFANSPEQLQHVKALQQRTFEVKSRDGGEPYYVYADAEGCKCMYYGTPKEYQKYLTLEQEQQVAADYRLNHVIRNANAEMYYTLWQGDDALPDTPPPPGTFPGM